MVRDDDEPGWGRQLLVVTGVLAAVALAIGGVVSLIALGAAKVTGLDASASRATARPSLYIPSGTPTVGLDQYPAPTKKSSPSASPSPSTSASSTPSATPTKKPSAITLQAFPQQVSPGQRISLTGVYRGGEGARLQVQQLDAGRWTNFPVAASVSGGQFTTYVITSRSGPQRFRVVDPLGHKSSNAVRVTIR